MKESLPKNWINTNLENLFKLIYGKGLSSKELLEEGYDVYGANGIIGKYHVYLYEKSKVIISCRGAASGVIHKTNPKSFITSNSIILDEFSDELLNLDFVKYAMTSLDKTDVITGTAQPQITIQLLKNLQFPLAPLSEQTRIVTKLDQLFSHLDKLKARLDTIPELLKQFRQAVLTQAVTGKLTEEWRKKNKITETAEEFIQRVIKERIEMGAKVQIFDSTNSKFPYKAPRNWTFSQINNFGELSRGKSKHRPRNDPKLYGGDYPFIQTGDVANSKGEINEYKTTYNEVGLAQSRLFPKGTLCITIAANIADTGILGIDSCFPDQGCSILNKMFITVQVVIIKAVLI